jgi:hypothetical protein
MVPWKWWPRVGASFASVLAVGCTGEPRILPPRTAPPRDVPALSQPGNPLPERYARIVLDTTDGPMRVEARNDPSFVPAGGPMTATRSGELCVTPCIVDLPVGRYRLYFSATEHVDAGSGDTDDLVVPEPGHYVFRRAPGQYRTPSIAEAIPPGAVIVLSSVALSAGLFIAGTNEDATTVGLGLSALGLAGGIAGGIWAYDASRATQQQGTTTFWRQR